MRKGRSFSHPISPAISCTSHPRTTKGHNVLASKLSAEGLGGRARADWLLHRRAPGCTAHAVAPGGTHRGGPPQKGAGIAPEVDPMLL